MTEVPHHTSGSCMLPIQRVAQAARHTKSSVHARFAEAHIDIRRQHDDPTTEEELQFRDLHRHVQFFPSIRGELGSIWGAIMVFLHTMSTHHQASSCVIRQMIPGFMTATDLELCMSAGDRHALFNASHQIRHEFQRSCGLSIPDTAETELVNGYVSSILKGVICHNIPRSDQGGFMLHVHKQKECTRKCGPMTTALQRIPFISISPPERGGKHHIATGGYTHRIDAAVLIQQHLNGLYVTGKTTRGGCQRCTQNKQAHSTRHTAVVPKAPDVLPIHFDPPVTTGVVFEEIEFLDSVYHIMYNTIVDSVQHELSCYTRINKHMYRYYPNTGIMMQGETIPHAWGKQVSLEPNRMKPHCVLPHKTVHFAVYMKIK